MSNSIINAVQKSMVPSTPGKCPFCDKQGLLTVPLRHSAFCSDSQMLLDKVAVVMMRAGLARLAWVGLIITGVIWLLGPEVIEAWCEKSVFRKLKKNKAFKGVPDELIELETAFNKMLGG